MSVSFPFWHIHTGNFIGTVRRRKVGSKEKTPSLLLTPIADADAAAVESAVEKSYQAMRVATFHLYEYYKTRH